MKINIKNKIDVKCFEKLSKINETNFQNGCVKYREFSFLLKVKYIFFFPCHNKVGLDPSLHSNFDSKFVLNSMKKNKN